MCQSVGAEGQGLARSYLPRDIQEEVTYLGIYRKKLPKDLRTLQYLKSLTHTIISVMDRS